MHSKQISKLDSDEHGKVIEITAPVRFYWTKEGKFDGIEVGPLDVSNYQLRLLDEVMHAMQITLDAACDHIDSDIPKVFTKAFEEDE